MKLKEKIYHLFHKPKKLVPRTVYFNQDLPSNLIDPSTHRPTQNFNKNEIRTAKYTPFSFIPKNLFFQFQNVANIYFLFLIILGAFQIFGVENPGLSAVPLIAIVVITAIKDSFEDSRRTISDLELNNNPVSILRGIRNTNVIENNISLGSKFNSFNSIIFVKMVKFFAGLFGKKDKVLTNIEAPHKHSFETIISDIKMNGEFSGNDIPNSIMQRVQTNATTDTARKFKPTKFTKLAWKNIKVGDIVRIHNNEEAPADLIIISTSDIDNKVFIETKNLDGETNLKSRKGLNLTHDIKRSKDFLDLKFKVNSEAPNANMYSYKGSVVLGDNNNDEDSESPNIEPLNIENLILRGSTVRNTKWVLGFVLFTGHETKIMLNSGITPSKKSRISKELNLSVIINFLILFILCFVSGVINGIFYYKTDTSFTLFEYEAYGSTPAINGIINFFVSMNIYQALVPISLYITVEIIKSLQAFFIYSDIEMYYEDLDYPCTPKSWNISDDLGQIEYIFSDKTGTLTQNVMEFKKASIGGRSYGLAYTEAQAGMDKREGIDTDAEMSYWKNTISKDKQDMIQELSSLPENPQFNADNLTFISSEYVKDLKSNTDQAVKNYEFMLCLTLCHTVLTEESKEKKGKLDFKAESPDEAALVSAANDVGFTFLKRTRVGGLVLIHGEEKEFEVLKVLPFNSTRKRMSVIVRINNEIKIICKGADSVIFIRLDPTKNDKASLNTTAKHLEEYASEGLRTLYIAGRTITQLEFDNWVQKYDNAASALEDRDTKIEEASNLMERDFILYGGTAIEDRLQIGVPSSIEKLGRAGLKLWVLTGDKIETAINIGFSCNLLGNNMILLVLRSRTDDDDVCDEKEKEKLDPKSELDSKLSEYLRNFNMTGSLDELKQAKTDHSIPTSNYAVIVDGISLTTVFEDEDLKRKFLLLCKQCKSVLCCRVSPAQKASVVKLVKDSLGVMTLSIGDGANDVAMIQTANVGVGIVGEEGRQAAMSSDYAIGQFRFLERLILVHGRWDYKRLAEVIPLFFYKNVNFTLTLFWYGIFNNFDGSYLLQFTIIMLYNLAFTSLPVIFLGVLDQDVSAEVSLQVPQLYKTGILRQEWSQYKFLWYMLDGLYQSTIAFFFPWLIFRTGIISSYNGLTIDHRFWIGVFVTHISVTSSDIYTLLRQQRWDWLTLLIDTLSILLVFFWIGIYSAGVYASEFYKAAPQVYGQASFWACFFAGVLVSILPRFIFSTLQTMYKPRDIDLIRECVAKGDFESKNKHEHTWNDREMVDLELSQESSQESTRPHTSLDRIRTTHDVPGITQAESLVKMFTQSSSISHE